MTTFKHLSRIALLLGAAALAQVASAQQVIKTGLARN